MLRANSFKSEFVRTIDGAAYQLTQCLLKLNKITDGALIRIVSLYKGATSRGFCWLSSILC